MEAEFNEIIHAPLRIRNSGLLRPVKENDFAVLRDAMDINDVNLSSISKCLPWQASSPSANWHHPAGTIHVGSPG